MRHYLLAGMFSKWPPMKAVLMFYILSPELFHQITTKIRGQEWCQKASKTSCPLSTAVLQHNTFNKYPVARQLRHYLIPFWRFELAPSDF